MKKSLLLLFITALLTLPVFSAALAADVIESHSMADAVARAKAADCLIIIDYAMDN